MENSITNNATAVAMKSSNRSNSQVLGMAVINSPGGAVTPTAGNLTKSLSVHSTKDEEIKKVLLDEHQKEEKRSSASSGVVAEANIVAPTTQSLKNNAATATTSSLSKGEASPVNEIDAEVSPSSPISEGAPTMVNGNATDMSTSGSNLDNSMSEGYTHSVAVASGGGVVSGVSENIAIQGHNMLTAARGNREKDNGALNTTVPSANTVIEDTLKKQLGKSIHTHTHTPHIHSSICQAINTSFYQQIQKKDVKRSERERERERVGERSGPYKDLFRML